MEQIKIHHGLDKILSLKKRFQENVNKCCGERYRKRQRRERELLVGPPSVSHSSHSRSQGIVLTEITPMTLCNNISHSTCHPNGSVETNVKLETKFQGSEV
ncbi:unnamed protein product [Orchesella dallaii]|uniref:Uncharacterized protein n=1 Tax=Orchesella dallaii TaxID=48710 RepID=A0ABP1PXM3_9HEXA